MFTGERVLEFLCCNVLFKFISEFALVVFELGEEGLVLAVLSAGRVKESEAVVAMTFYF